MILYAGLREDSMDYKVYKVLYKNYNDITIEYAFKLISFLVQNFFGGNIKYLFLIFAFLAVSLKFKAIKILSSSVVASICIYYSNYYLLHEMTQIRAGVASAFLLLAIKPIYERDFKKFLIYAALGFSFHYSALVILPLWFLRNKINFKLLFCSIFVGYAFYFLGISIITIIPIPGVQEKIEIYLKLQESDEKTINVFNYLYLARIIIFYILLLNFKKLVTYNKYLPILLNIYSISIVSYTVFASVPAFASRISEFFGVVEIILFPLLMYLFKPVILGRFVVAMIALIFLLINLYYVKLIFDI
jgi:hypothetical protein